MCEFTKCCCCIDLKIGTIIIAILELVAGILYLALAIIQSDNRLALAITQSNNSASAIDCEDSTTPICPYITSTAVFGYLNRMVALVTGLCLLYGSVYHNKKATLLYLNLKIIGIVLAAINMIAFIGAAVMIGFAIVIAKSFGSVILKHILYWYGLVPSICIAVFMFIYIILQIYFWICVYSHYTRRFKKERLFLKLNTINSENVCP